MKSLQSLKMPRHAVLLLIALSAAAAGGCGKADRARPESSGVSTASTTTSGAGAHPDEHATTAPRRAKLEVHAELAIEVDSERSAVEVARALESLVTARGGFLELSSLSDSSGTSRVIVRVPPSDLPSVRAIVAAAQKDGTALRETQTSKDVTEALADLDARLHSAREEETRLLKLLGERTGSLSDVLAVERTLADVRERIERLQADQRLGEGRVELATVEVLLHSQSSAAIEPSLTRRIRGAATEGLITARDALVGAFVVMLRVGPLLTIFAAFAFAIWNVRRRLRRSPPLT